MLPSRKGKRAKIPSMWTMSSWIERIIMVFGPILLIYIILIMLGVVKI